jgi:hypothetical protein
MVLSRYHVIHSVANTKGDAMAQGPVRYVRGSGRSTPVLIVPVERVVADHSTCRHCTWVAVVPGVPGHLQMQLKYVSAACHVHQKVTRISAW